MDFQKLIEMLFNKSSPDQKICDWGDRFVLSDDIRKTWGIKFTFGDFLKYHQGTSICGLSLGFKLIQKLIDHFKDPLQKSNIKIFGNFGGRGMSDAFDYIFRGERNESNFFIKKDLNINLECSDAPIGRYGYEIKTSNRILYIGIKPKVVRKDFLNTIRLRNKGKVDPEKVSTLQWEMCQRVVPIPSANVCNIKEI